MRGAPPAPRAIHYHGAQTRAVPFPQQLIRNRGAVAAVLTEHGAIGYFLAPGGGSLGAARIYSSFFGAFRFFAFLFPAVDRSDTS
jgi:hypothetical protein